MANLLDRIVDESLRLDGTTKSMMGFLGPMSQLTSLDTGQRPPPTMTEFSIGAPNTPYLFRPSLVPTLTQDEILQIRLGNITPEIQRKSLEHALNRRGFGRPVFFDDSEIPEQAMADRFITQGPVAR